MNYLYRNITDLRKLKGYTQQNLADMLGMTRSKIAAYEENRNEPNISFLIRVADHFHVTIDELIKGKF